MQRGGGGDSLVGVFWTVVEEGSDVDNGELADRCGRHRWFKVLFLTSNSAAKARSQGSSPEEARFVEAPIQRFLGLLDNEGERQGRMMASDASAINGSNVPGAVAGTPTAMLK